MSTNMFSVLFFVVWILITKHSYIHTQQNKTKSMMMIIETGVMWSHFFLSHVTSDVEPTVDNLFFFFDLALFFSLFFFPLIIVVIIIIIHFGLSSSCPIWTAQIEWWKFIIQTLFILGISFFLSIFFHCSLILLCRQI